MTIELNINGINYKISSLPAMANYALFVKFQSYVGASFQDIGELITSNNYSCLGSGIHKIFSSLYINDPNLNIIFDILHSTTRDGIPLNKANFDTFYSGNIEEANEIIFESMKVHFKPFLKKLLDFGFLNNLGAVTNYAENSTKA